MMMMMMKCEICGGVEEGADALESGLAGEGEHLHVCSSCVKDRQFAGSFKNAASHFASEPVE
ncbi:hypothetical protein [Paenibacillus aestuarii]|uniref:GapA-binding peptide SR1P n=1 Tax=Paenibacillus aestuarii TaxID=516965 RepID=A0ABW0K3N8_9BACL|nr:hypothetical protein [Paenibacillus aestuarii]